MILSFPCGGGHTSEKNIVNDIVFVYQYNLAAFQNLKPFRKRRRRLFRVTYLFDILRNFKFTNVFGRIFLNIIVHDHTVYPKKHICFLQIGEGVNSYCFD